MDKNLICLHYSTIVRSIAEMCFFEVHTFQNTGYDPFLHIQSHIFLMSFNTLLSLLCLIPIPDDLVP